MTKDEILAMKAGRDLDLLVCAKVFDNKTFGSVKHYSTNMSAAWQVAEKMVSSGYAFCFDWASGKVATVIRCIFEENFSKAESEESEWIDGKTAPEAICKAALLTRLEGNKGGRD